MGAGEDLIGRSRVQSRSVLVAMLNRLGGRTDAPAAHRDLVALAPAYLPLVEVRREPGGGVRVLALNVAELMARYEGDEATAMELLSDLVREGARREDAGTFWTTRDRRDLARQTLQWALDHADAALTAEAFVVARAVADER